jgi:hypothetical protein
MATYSTNGCSPANPNSGTSSIFLNNVTGPGVVSITVHNQEAPGIQGTLSRRRANIYLNRDAFIGFSLFIRNNPLTTVHFEPTDPIPPSFSWP